MKKVTLEALESSHLISAVPTDVVVQIDAIELLRLLPDESIDLMITDPAYESLEKHRAKGTTTRLKQSDASSNEWFPIFRDVNYGPLMSELYRVMKPATHAYFFCDETTADVLKPVAREAGFWVWKTIVWVKTIQSLDALQRLVLRELRGMGSSKEVLDQLRELFLANEPAALLDGLTRTGMGYHWRGSCERILMLEKRTVKQERLWYPSLDPTGKGRQLNNLGAKDVLYGTPVLGKGAYPTEKPQGVVEKLVLNSSNPGDLVLDPFAGSGVVGRACAACGRQFLLGDVSEKAMARMMEDP